jgi:hypothetical protein
VAQALSVGQALQIRLSSNQAQTGFDKIALSVPDGGMTLTLLGGALVALGALRRKLKRNRPRPRSLRAGAIRPFLRTPACEHP